MSSESHILTEPVASAACPKCGAMLEVKELLAFTAVQCPTCEFEFQVPARFGSFLLLQLLGAGGMGGVYRARDEGLNREVAIKVMLQSLGEDQNFNETFQREAQAAAKLNHPHIAQIYSFGQFYGQPYIVMELISGGSLDKMMTAQGPMDPAVVMHIGVQIAEGLREAAEAGLVHGDVKPENILFDLDKNAKLVDFGLAAMQSGPGNDVWGTPFYIAPEKVRRQKADYRSDIYSLGATLYHAIAGVPPFDGQDATAVVKARFDGPPKALRDIRGNVPDEVESMIARMLEVEPQMRFPTYGSLLGDMRRYLSKAGPIQMGGSSKKIMIKGKRPKDTTGAMSMTGTLTTTGTVSEMPSGMVPVGEISEESESEEAAGQRARKMFALMGAGVVLLLLLVGGAIFGGMHHVKVTKQRAEQAQIGKSQEKARASIANSVSEAGKRVAQVKAFVPEALDYAKAAAEVVVGVLGEGVRTAMVPPEPEYAVPKAQPAATAPAPAGSNAVASAGSSNVVASAGASNEVPLQAVAPAPEAAPVAEPAEQGKEQHPVVAIVRSMYEDAYAVKGASLLAEALAAEVEAQAKAAEALTSAGQLDALIKAANALVEKVKTLAYTREISEVPRRVSQLKKTLESVKTDAASLVELKRQEAVEKAKRAKADEAAEKRRLEQEALKEKAQNEMARVAAVEVENVALLKQLQFREAARALKDLTDGLETKGGLDELALAEERVNRVKEFHAYLVEKVPGFKSSRGWSIESADKDNLSVAGKKIQWVDVYATRLDIVAELINGLVMDEKAIKGLGLRQKTRLMTNASLCLALFYKDMPSAQEKAKQLAAKAALDFEADADSIKQLLPAFFKE